MTEIENKQAAKPQSDWDGDIIPHTRQRPTQIKRLLHFGIWRKKLREQHKRERKEYFEKTHVRYTQIHYTRKHNDTLQQQVNCGTSS